MEKEILVEIGQGSSSSAIEQEAPVTVYSGNPKEWNPRWVPDGVCNKCQICGIPFTFWIRRHHCRRCGHCICYSCSAYQVAFVRVCNPCKVQHDSQAALFARKQDSLKHNLERTNHRLSQCKWLVLQNIINVNSYPYSSPEAGLQQITERMMVDSFDLIEQLLATNQIAMVDLIIDTLSLSEDQLGMQDRIAIIHLLDEVIMEHTIGMLQFNSIAIWKLQSRTRLSRLRVLLNHLNEELPICEEVLDHVHYKSIVFEKILAKMSMRYTLILDRSGSMHTHDTGHSKSRWHTAKAAVEHMAEQVERLVSTKKGMTLWMFSSPPHSRYTDLKTCEDVESVFCKEKPHGLTDLSGVLRQAFEDHLTFNQPEHILVVTDGEPSNRDDVITVLVEFINKLSSPDQLGITFMQVGEDSTAADYLHNIQDHIVDLGAKYAVGRLFDLQRL